MAVTFKLDDVAEQRIAQLEADVKALADTVRNAHPGSSPMSRADIVARGDIDRIDRFLSATFGSKWWDY